MSNLNRRSFLGLSAAAAGASMLAACGGGSDAPAGGADTSVDPADLTLPLAETATITGLTNYPVGSEPEPNNRTIFKRLEEETNVHVDWKTIQADQWGDKISLEMSNINTLPDMVFNAGFGDTELLKYAKQGVIINVEELHRHLHAQPAARLRAGSRVPRHVRGRGGPHLGSALDRAAGL